MNEKLLNPYASLPDDEKYCLRGMVSRHDWQLIQSIFPVYGFPSVLVARLIAKLAHEIRENNWNLETHPEFLNYVNKLTDTTGKLLIERNPTSVVDGKRPHKHDRRRNPRVQQRAEVDPSNEPHSDGTPTAEEIPEC